MRIPRFAFVAAILAAVFPCSLEAQYIWTGLQQPTGWQGQVTPPNNGTAILQFGDSIYPFVTFSGSLNDINTITLANGNNFIFAGSTTLTIVGGIASADSQIGDMYFESGVNVAIGSSTTFNAGENSLYFAGQITGSGSLTLTGGPLGDGAIVYSNTTGNSYSGPTTVGDGTSNSIQVAFWGPNPFGLGTNTVTLNGNSQLIAHNTETISNPIMIDSMASISNVVGFKSWDAPLTIAGPVTLQNNATFAIKTSVTYIAAPLDEGSIFLPGPGVSNPIVFSGGISGAHSLTFQGTGVAILESSGGDTYSGGTTVGTASGTTGNLVFASASSIPSSGTILVEPHAYVGIADPTVGSFATLLTYVNSSVGGSYGFDTLPGNSTATYSGPVDLSGLSSANVEIGTATSAILTGAITPKSGTLYKFGGGGGTLYVDTNLANVPTYTTGLSVVDPGNTYSLLVYLQGTNTYGGPTTANDGFLIFNGANSIPAGSALSATTVAGSNGNVGASYMGYTDNVTGMTPATFLGMFTVGSTYGIIGFDTKTPGTPVTISNPINLAAFNDGVYIGTATDANLTGALTPTADSTLRFTAVEGGLLKVSSTISGGVSVVLGSPSQFGQFSSGTVVMSGPNTYTGGTTLNAGNSSGLTVALGNSSALGTGAVTITQPSSYTAATPLVGLQASAAGVNLSNPINIQDTSGSNSAHLYLTGTNNFTLSGSLTGDPYSSIVLDNASPLTVTLSGSNTGFSGEYSVYNGTLVLANTSALGNATLDFEGPGTIDLSAAVNPIIQTITGAENNGSLGTLIIPSSLTLTFNTTNDNNNNNPTFGGTIKGSGSITVDDTSGGNSGAVVLLYGNNNYSGGTQVIDGGVLVAASSSALGTGPVTVNATSGHGGLGLDSGVTLTNPLTLTGGYLVGDGTFNPSSQGLMGTITIGPNQGVAGGLPFANNDIIPGTLNFAGNLAFNTGGAYYWTLQDDSRMDGKSSIAVAGNLTINATAGGFTIYAVSFDASGNKGNQPGSFSLSSLASWTILTTGGMINNFSASDFTIDSSNFDGGVAASHFSLSVNGGDQLVLNFTPVPEPSTWALLAAGLGLVSLAMVRRRRLAAAT